MRSLSSKQVPCKGLWVRVPLPPHWSQYLSLCKCLIFFLTKWTCYTSCMEEVIRWHTHEHAAPKSTDWYLALGIIAVAGAATSFILGNILFSILIIVGALSLSLHAARPHKETAVEINQRGLVLNETLYPYESLESFWVEENESMPKLFIKSERTLVPQLIIFLEDTAPEIVHEYLLEHLEEEEMTEPFTQKIAEFFGF